MAAKAFLALEDGAVFHGYSFGYEAEAEGEVVFCTSMTGYQEVCTDPSYRGQMVVMTHPMIGNYGVTDSDAESRRPWVQALVVREYYPGYSNWRAQGSLHDYLLRHGIPGLAGLDTRALTRHLRARGTMRGVLVGQTSMSVLHQGDPRDLVERAKAVTPISLKDVVGEVSREDVVELPPLGVGPSAGRVVVVDGGCKGNIVESLRRRGLSVVVVPHRATAAEILALSPAGVVLSNGPGDPASLPYMVATARGLVEAQVPLMGICLGHQVLGLAIGATTSRLKFGHHGGNHPVKDLGTGRVYITTQNHEFQVDRDSIPEANGFHVSHVNLNDSSVEGLAHREFPVFSVQYHPEGSPGPQDNQYLFDRFVGMVRQGRASC